VIGKLIEKNLRDINEYCFLVKRDNKIIDKNPYWLNMVIEDDTDSIHCTIERSLYQKFGKEIVENGSVGDYYLIKGTTSGEWRKIKIQNIRRL
jgi:hypothetical protein